MKKKKKKEEKNSPEAFIIFILLVILIPNIILFINLTEKEKSQIDIYLPSQVTKFCSNNDIFEDADCVRDFTKVFYKYNLFNVNKNLTFLELKEQGSTCEAWSKYYCSFGKELGYYTTILEFNTKKIDKYMISHQICVWSDESGYVIFDADDTVNARFKGFNITELEEVLRNNGQSS